MSGQTNLSEVLKSIRISCDDIEYSFASTGKKNLLTDDGILGTFKEAEGLTVIATSEYFQKNNIKSEGVYAKLTVEIHTSLELVGLTAILASELAKNQISANVVAAYYHDHIFVKFSLRQKAIKAIESLKNSQG